MAVRAKVEKLSQLPQDCVPQVSWLAARVSRAAKHCVLAIWKALATWPAWPPWQAATTGVLAARAALVVASLVMASSETLPLVPAGRLATAVAIGGDAGTPSDAFWAKASLSRGTVVVVLESGEATAMAAGVYPCCSCRPPSPLSPFVCLGRGSASASVDRVSAFEGASVTAVFAKAIVSTPCRARAASRDCDAAVGHGTETA